MNRSSVLVAMSGGVDSSVAAALLVDAGYEVIGVTMKMADAPRAPSSKAGCCTVEDADDARAVAARLGIAHYVLDFSEGFGRRVVDRFVAEYAAGRTPNPCVDCNRHIKFTELVARADELGIDYVASGHYARLEGGRLFRGVDRDKDQSYVLACLSPGIVDRVLLPVGVLHKDDVRSRAAQLGLRTAHKPESMEVCFLGEGGKTAFLERRLDLEPGPVIDARGEVIGRHDGAALYTIGQRRGVGVAVGARAYVQRIEVGANVVHVAPEPPTARRFVADAATWFRCPDADRILVQVSAHGSPCPAEIRLRREGRVVDVSFSAPVPKPAPGQLAAFYSGDEVIGAATIRCVGALEKLP